MSVHPLRLPIAAAALALLAPPAFAIDVFWVGPNGSNWSLATNWNPGLPGAADDARLGAFDTTFNSGTVTVNSLQGSGTLSLLGGTLRPMSSSSVGALVLGNFGQGTLGGTGVLTTGTLDWRGGTMGQTGVNAGGTTRVTGDAQFNGQAQLVLQEQRRLELQGTSRWTAGDSQLRIFGSGATAGVLAIAPGASFIDAGTLDPNANRLLGFSGGSGRIDNGGLFERQGLGRTNVLAPLNNAAGARVALTGGTLELGGGGRSSGQITIADGTTMQLGGNGGTSYLIDGGSLRNDGALQVNSDLTLAAGVLYTGSGSLAVAGNGFFDSAAPLTLSQASMIVGTMRVRDRAQVDQLALRGGLLGGSGEVTVGTLQWSGGTMGETAGAHAGGRTTVTGTALLDGTRVDVQTGRTLVLDGTTTWAAGASRGIVLFGSAELLIGPQGRFADLGTELPNDPSRFIGFNNQGLLRNLGTYTRSGVGTTSLRGVVENSGLIDVQGGTLELQRELQGAGTLRIGSLGSVVATTRNSMLGVLDHQGGPSSLALSTRTLTVGGDYMNAAFGVGNAFDRHANVSLGTGRILASGDANQALVGAGLAGGATGTPTLVIGNVHVGGQTLAYGITNGGKSGPVLRGAVQPGANGGNISDPRLSGNGVESGNWGPVAPGQVLARELRITVDSAGVYAPISGQAVSLVNNFDNTRSQVLTISSAPGAAAYHLAAAAALAPNPLSLPNQRVGGTASTVVPVTNAAPAGSFTEGLDAAFGQPTGALRVAGGPVSLLAGGATSQALSVSLDTTAAGARAGQVPLLFTSNGNGSSGLGLTPLPTQPLVVQGNIYQPAAGTLLTPTQSFVLQVGQTSAPFALQIRNGASGPAGFVEDLNARFGAFADTNPQVSVGLAGQVNQLAAGATSNGAMTVSVTGRAAGTVNQLAVPLNFFSAGSVGGQAIAGLAEMPVGGATFFVDANVSLNIVDLARPVTNGVASPQPVAVNLGNLRQGAAPQPQALTLLNQASGNAQAQLNASLTSDGAPVLASGNVTALLPGQSNTSALSVALDTSTAGPRSGSATLALISDASNQGNCAPNCQLALSSQTVQVSGAVYRLAQPQLDTPAVTIAARVGDAVAADRAVRITNASPDIYTEGLNVAVTGASGNAQSNNGGVISNLAARASNAGSILVGLASTAVAGVSNGLVQLGFISTGAQTTDAPDVPAAIPAAAVAVTGHVFTPARGEAAQRTLDFGVVRVNDVVSPRNLVFSNTAAVTALNDTLRVDLNGLAGPFSGGSALTGVMAGDSGIIAIELATAVAGRFSAPVQAHYTSQNAEMPDAAFGASELIVSAQVNNLANARFELLGGGTLSDLGGGDFLLDLGTLGLGQALHTTLALANEVQGPADELSGLFDLQLADDFSYTDWNPVDHLAAGASVQGLQLAWRGDAAGRFEDRIVFLGRGTNASDAQGLPQRRRLFVRGTVADQPPGKLPVPGSLWLVLAGAAAAAALRRLRRAT